MSARSRKGTDGSRATRRSPLGGRAARADASQAGVTERNRRAAPHLTSLDDGRAEAAGGGRRARRGGGARAQLRGPRPLVPQSRGTCCAAEKCVLQIVSNTASSRRAKTAGPHLEVPSHRMAKAKERRHNGGKGRRLSALYPAPLLLVTCASTNAQSSPTASRFRRLSARRDEIPLWLNLKLSIGGFLHIWPLPLYHIHKLTKTEAPQRRAVGEGHGGGGPPTTDGEVGVRWTSCSESDRRSEQRRGHSTGQTPRARGRTARGVRHRSESARWLEAP